MAHGTLKGKLIIDFGKMGSHHVGDVEFEVQLNAADRTISRPMLSDMPEALRTAAREIEQFMDES